MAARAPRFAWWVIPATLGVGLLGGMMVGLIAGIHFFEVGDVPVPPGYKRLDLRGPPIDRFTLGEDVTVLARWAIFDESRTGGLMLGRLDGVERIDAEFLTGLEQKLRGRAGTKFETHASRIESIAGRSMAVLDVTDGDKRTRLAVTRLGGDAILLIADSSERDDSHREAFASMLEALGRLRLRRRAPNAYELGEFAGSGCFAGLLACIPAAFFVSVRRRRAWERAELDRVAAKAAAS